MLRAGVWMNRFSRVLVTGGAGFIGSYMVNALMLPDACGKLKFVGAVCYWWIYIHWCGYVWKQCSPNG